MELTPGYKQTDLGVIPEDWEIKALKDICALKNGFAFSSDFFSNVGPIVLTPGNFRLEGGLYFEDRNTKRYSGTYTPNMIFNRGDLLVVMTDLTPDCKLLGKPAFVESDETILHNQRIGKIIFKDKSTEPQFLFYLLLSRQYLDRIREQATGSTVRHTSTRSIYSIKLPWPKAPEQRAIATALSDVDALIASLDQLVAKKRDLKQAAMQQLLTGQTRLPGFKGEWVVKKLGDIANLYQPTTISANQFTESGYPVYGANGVVGFYHTFNHDCWQVTVTCRGSTCGTVNRTVEKCWITGNAMVIGCDQRKDLNKYFLYYTLSNQDLSVCITGSGQPQIVRGPLASIELRVPREVGEQIAIAAVLSDMDSELAALEQRQDKTRALKQGMMQELLTGRTRLV
jgi:type I restriction enzyme S subunit